MIASPMLVLYLACSLQIANANKAEGVQLFVATMYSSSGCDASDVTTTSALPVGQCVKVYRNGVFTDLYAKGEMKDTEYELKYYSNQDCTDESDHQPLRYPKECTANNGQWSSGSISSDATTGYLVVYGDASCTEQQERWEGYTGLDMCTVGTRGSLYMGSIDRGAEVRSDVYNTKDCSGDSSAQSTPLKASGECVQYPQDNQNYPNYYKLEIWREDGFGSHHHMPHYVWALLAIGVLCLVGACVAAVFFMMGKKNPKKRGINKQGAPPAATPPAMTMAAPVTTAQPVAYSMAAPAFTTVQQPAYTTMAAPAYTAMAASTYAPLPTYSVAESPTYTTVLTR